MNDTVNPLPLFIIALLLGFLCGIVTFGAFGEYSTVHSKAYKQGQIDYVNGIIKYELKKMPDGTTQWVKISKDQ